MGLMDGDLCGGSDSGGYGGRRPVTGGPPVDQEVDHDLVYPGYYSFRSVSLLVCLPVYWPLPTYLLSYFPTLVLFTYLLFNYLLV